MRIFVLSTGRSGTSTFVKACKHMTNYTCGHESNWSKIGVDRLTYPDHHIEVDNRLVWMLGRLDIRYGDDAFYVHLIRNKEDTIKSFNKRWKGKPSIIRAYAEDILVRDEMGLKECQDYYETINSNIYLFLKDKNNKLQIHLNNISKDFEYFWETINGEGDLSKAVNELNKKHNKSKNHRKVTDTFNLYLWKFKKKFSK